MEQNPKDNPNDWRNLARLLSGEENPKWQTSTDDLVGWWTQTANDELGDVLPKAIEYGSADLKIIGFAMSQMIGKPTKVTHEELGIAFYLLGKVARLIGAYADGRSPSDDTWHDIAIYTKMAQFSRTFGHWGDFK